MNPGVPPRIIAHRGFSGIAPENTVAAIDAAIGAGADGVEFDLRGTADRIPVLFHDETLERTTDGHGAVHEWTAAALDTLDAGSWYSRAFQGEPVPTLARALDRVSESREWRGLIFPEIKGPAPRWLTAGTAEAVLRRDLGERTILISIDWDALLFIRSEFPGLRVGFVVEHARDVFDALALCRERPGDVLDPDRRILLENPDVAEEARGAGIRLACWTVDDTGEAESLSRMGVEDVTSNEVSRLLDWRRRRPPGGPEVG